MRWRLLIVTSLVAAILGFFVWEVPVIVLFNEVRPVEPHDQFLIASAIIPLTFAALGAVFIYRHTARWRKAQTAISVLLTIVLMVATYLTVSRLIPSLAIPKACREANCA
ncbi:MAG TPA: hypothetical protein VE961_04895 [Pyrinomonadaceae bacterium]|nr:hypothetical protein [Pyrinomonadaceae bacterium]